jgi:hypothetical protein
MLFGLSATANATISGTGCILSGNAGQTLPSVLANFATTCAAQGAANNFSFNTGGNDNLNFQVIGTDPNNTPGHFLSNVGAVVNGNPPSTGGGACAGGNASGACGLPGSTGSAGGGGLSTWYDFHYVTVVGTTFIMPAGITHDDGIGLFIDGVLMTPLAALGPTSNANTAVNIGGLANTAHTIDLLYDECCGVPAVLIANLPNEAPNTVIPEPSSIVLLGSVMIGVTTLLRRRKVS